MHHRSDRLAGRRRGCQLGMLAREQGIEEAPVAHLALHQGHAQGGRDVPVAIDEVVEDDRLVAGPL